MTMTPEEIASEIEAAEVAGRTARKVKWSIRDVGPYDVMPNDPRRYVLEIWHNMNEHGQPRLKRLEAVTEADMEGLRALCEAFLSGAETPLGPE